MDELKPCPFCGEKQDIDYGIMTGSRRGNSPKKLNYFARTGMLKEYDDE